MIEEQHENLAPVLPQQRGMPAAEILEQHTVHALERAAGPLQQSLHKATEALLERQATDGHWRFDLEADATIPSEYILLQYFLGRMQEKPLDKNRALSAETSARERQLASVPRWAWQYERNGQGLFRLEAQRPLDGCALHGAGAALDPDQRRCGEGQRVHAHRTRDLRAGAVADGAGDAGRDHVLAALVVFQPE